MLVCIFFSFHSLRSRFIFIDDVRLCLYDKDDDGNDDNHSRQILTHRFVNGRSRSVNCYKRLIISTDERMGVV